MARCSWVAQPAWDATSRIAATRGEIADVDPDIDSALLLRLIEPAARLALQMPEHYGAVELFAALHREDGSCSRCSRKPAIQRT